ncbi:MAG: hypothetical protein LBP79_05550 [Clostridiales bacterium]|jgi:hypothetical protein|nr:hypothetical protein [Clostridiales bacterium]
MATDTVLAEKDAKKGITPELIGKLIRFGIATLLLAGIIAAFFLPFVKGYKAEIKDESGIVIEEAAVDFSGFDLLVSSIDVILGKESLNKATKYLVNAESLGINADYALVTISKVLPIAALLTAFLYLANYIMLTVFVFIGKLKKNVNAPTVLQLLAAVTVISFVLLLQIYAGGAALFGAGLLVLIIASVLTVAYQPIVGESLKAK